MTPILIIFILGGGLLICTLVAIRWDKIIKTSREQKIIKTLSMGPPHIPSSPRMAGCGTPGP